MVNNIAEFRYGYPPADKVLVNKYYSVGYSYLFKQPKWALEVIDNRKNIKRLNNFRPDFRIPEQFRANLDDFKNSGYDRGHLIASQDKDNDLLENSETFLLSNMTAQKHALNAGPWEDLEQLIIMHDKQEFILETFVISGPIYALHKPIEYIGGNDKTKIVIPVPHEFFKSILTQDVKGNINMHAYIMPNTDPVDRDLTLYVCTVDEIEKKSGMILWPSLHGKEIWQKKTESKILNV